MCLVPFCAAGDAPLSRGRHLAKLAADLQLRLVSTLRQRVLTDPVVNRGISSRCQGQAVRGTGRFEAKWPNLNCVVADFAGGNFEQIVTAFRAYVIPGLRGD